MTISPYAIEQLAAFVTGDGHPPKRSGRELIKLFNNYGSRDVYDKLGLPDIDKKNGLRPSRTEYVKARLGQLSNKPELRELLSHVINELENNENDIMELNTILNPEKYGVIHNGGYFIVEGGIVDRRKPVVNEAHFQEIQNKILAALDVTRVSVRVVMAWFTNETLFNKLLEKHNAGIDVKVAIYDDGVNKKHGVDVAKLPHVMIKRGKHGGLMHDKFCVIDNQVVITGSYNWTNNAEFRNDENITIERDPEQATRFSEEFMRLTK
jgi:phosphatidylserine/phosphatidylglycerophosphate/cardiolipin synthase-like enzyme